MRTLFSAGSKMSLVASIICEKKLIVFIKMFSQSWKRITPNGKSVRMNHHISSWTNVAKLAKLHGRESPRTQQLGIYFKPLFAFLEVD
jgi:hypothetical protein